MTGRCEHEASGAIEQYFYGELGPSDHDEMDRHLRACAACRAVVEDLSILRSALARRMVVDAPARDDWSGFMARLREAIDDDPVGRDVPGPTRIGEEDDSAPIPREWRQALAPGRRAASPPWARSGLIATAAVLAFATTGVAVVMRSRVPSRSPSVTASRSVTAPADLARDGFEALGEEHLQRSKLVVLGLAAKDPARATSADWMYERELAASLLSDTRMYRMAAEERGLRPMAEVMRDLEVVLLQTSFTDTRDPAALAGIQRLIRKRDLVGKMDVVAISGL